MSDKPDNTPENTTPAPIGEIKHGPSGFEQFLDENQKKLIIGGIALIVILVSYVIFDGLKTQAQKDAAAAFSAATDITQLRAAADEHSGTAAAGSALYRIAQEQWADQRQQEAIETLNTFTADYPEHPLVINAKATLGSYYTQLEETDKAKAAYTEVVDAGHLHELYSLALINLGDIALAEGDHEAAKGFYERIGTEFGEKPAVGIKELATKRIALIGVSPPTAKPKEPVPPALPANPKPVQTPATPIKPSDIKIPDQPAKEPVTPPTPPIEAPKSE